MPAAPFFYPIRVVFKTTIAGNDYGIAGHSGTPQVTLERFNPLRNRQQWKLHLRTDGFFHLINQEVDQALTVPSRNVGPLGLQALDPDDHRQKWTFEFGGGLCCLVCRYLTMHWDDVVPSCYVALDEGWVEGTDPSHTVMWSRPDLGKVPVSISMTPPDGDQEFESVYVCFESVLSDAQHTFGLEGESASPQVTLQDLRASKTSQHWRLAMTPRGRFLIINDDVDQVLTYSGRMNSPLRLQARDPENADNQEWWILPYQAWLVTFEPIHAGFLSLITKTQSAWADIQHIDGSYNLHPGAPVLGTNDTWLYAMNKGIFWRFTQPDIP